MADKYFKTQKKGEIFEIRQDLNSDKKDKKKDAVKKIISYMTVGKDVSELFPDVVNCMQTDNLELKKLVYLYLMNYAKSQPDMAILAVNTFVKDCDDMNPLIRALAVRTMGCIRVENIAEYLCEPLRKCLRDEDPYVRKTAAVCVSKLHSISPELVEDQGFLDALRDLLTDANPMVIANAVASLAEISSYSESASKFFELNSTTVNKLFTALNECTEWGQVFILDSLVMYNPSSVSEAQSICERVTSRLSHANAAVVLSAVKLLIKCLDLLPPDNPIVASIVKKMAPPLVTMLSAEPEIQYVALRNINLITQKNPEILKNEAKSFFVKYNDPIYVKLEKLSIIIKLANENNINQVLSELKEYSSEVDVDFVRRSVRAIGRCALKVESAADRCVNTLVDLIKTKVSYVVQESIIVVRDIMRRFPNKYESIIEHLCENLQSLDEPEAKAALIWIIGEYAERIDNASEILRSFVEGYLEENSQVQLQLLTAIVKLFLKKPSENQELVQSILTVVTQDCSNPDLRDRGYVYWRLLATDPASARDVILAQKPLISPEAENMEPSMLEELLLHLSTLASIYHKPPSTFVEGHAHWRRMATLVVDKAQKFEHDATGIFAGEDLLGPSLTGVSNPNAKPQSGQTAVDDLLKIDFGAPTTFTGQPAVAFSSSHNTISIATQVQPSVDLLTDQLFGLGISGQQTASAPTSSNFSTNNNVMDIFNISSSPVVSHQASLNLCCFPKYQLLNPSKAKGLEITGTFTFSNWSLKLCLTVTNHALLPMSGFLFQVNGNTFKIGISSPPQFSAVIAPRQSHDVDIYLDFNGKFLKMDPISAVQIAIKNNIDTFFFTVLVPLHYLSLSIDSSNEDSQMISQFTTKPEISQKINIISTLDSIKQTLKSNNFHPLQNENVGDLRFFLKLRDETLILVSISHGHNTNEFNILIKANQDTLQSAITTLEQILKC